MSCPGRGKGFPQLPVPPSQGAGQAALRFQEGWGAERLVLAILTQGEAPERDRDRSGAEREAAAAAAAAPCDIEEG